MKFFKRVSIDKEMLPGSEFCFKLGEDDRQRGAVVVLCALNGESARRDDSLRPTPEFSTAVLFDASSNVYTKLYTVLLVSCSRASVCIVFRFKKIEVAMMMFEMKKNIKDIIAIEGDPS